MNRTHEVRGIGRVTLRRSRRARRINIRVEAFVGVLVTVPWNVSYAFALQVLERHRQWVVRHLGVVREQESCYARSANTGQRVTRLHVLEAHADDTQSIGITVEQGVIHVSYPRTLNLDSPTVQRALHDGVLSAFRVEAKRYLPEKIRQLAADHGFSFERLSLKNLRSRWGSCSATNNINLNIQLMRLPDDLIDYVILHELVHTKVKNHGSRFWALLEKTARNARGLDAQLRKQRVWS